MAAIRLVYVGGGSTRAPGTVASIVDRWDDFAGSEIVLVDLDADRLAVVERLLRRLVESRGADLRVVSTTELPPALDGADAVLSSFRPGGFDARHLDESIPLRHGVIGQETQGAGGFFMALRSIAVLQGITAEMEHRCPDAILFNYTNPVNVVAEAVSRHSPIRIVSLCEGPLGYPRAIAKWAGLDPDRLRTVMTGLNHLSWSVVHEYDGRDAVPLIREGWEREQSEPALDAWPRRMLRLAATMQSLPADYWRYYYFRDDMLEELRTKGTTRSQDILAHVPDYWRHYEEQAAADSPTLDPARSRGGIHELELALHVMDAVFNDRGGTWPVNIPNCGSVPGFPDDLVVETVARVDRAGFHPLPTPPLPPHVRGLVEMLAVHQRLAADAAWTGGRRDGVRALAAHPLVLTLQLAETLYDEMAAAHRAYLPERLLR